MTKTIALGLVVAFVLVNAAVLLGLWAGNQVKDDQGRCQAIATARGFVVLDKYPYCVLANAEGQMYGFKTR